MKNALETLEEEATVRLVSSGVCSLQLEIAGISTPLSFAQATVDAESGGGGGGGGFDWD